MIREVIALLHNQSLKTDFLQITPKLILSARYSLVPSISDIKRFEFQIETLLQMNIIRLILSPNRRFESPLVGLVAI